MTVRTNAANCHNLTQTHNGSAMGGSRRGEYHAMLAMAAARRMRSTRQKQKTGREICHHLRMMLACETAPREEVQPGEQFRLKF